jgi:hypothetical protein
MVFREGGAFVAAGLLEQHRNLFGVPDSGNQTVRQGSQYLNLESRIAVVPWQSCADLPGLFAWFVRHELLFMNCSC